jgi:hypothetical protein
VFETMRLIIPKSKRPFNIPFQTSLYGLNLIYALFSIHPCSALQSLLGPGLAQKAPPFFSILSSSPSSYSEDPQCTPLDDILPSCSWFSYWSYVDALFQSFRMSIYADNTTNSALYIQTQTLFN